jgi:hypothetical protein
MYYSDFSGEYEGDFKSAVKSALQIPGKAFSTIIDPFAKGTANAVSTVGKGAGEAAGNVMKPFTVPLLIIAGIALAGGIGYIIYTKKKASRLLSFNPMTRINPS